MTAGEAREDRRLKCIHLFDGSAPGTAPVRNSSAHATASAPG